jgi:flagellar basal body rod protein FlgG
MVVTLESRIRRDCPPNMGWDHDGNQVTSEYCPTINRVHGCAWFVHVKDDAMKNVHFLISPIVVVVLAGCTVHHHHYNASSSAGPDSHPDTSPTVDQRLALIEELRGVQAAIAVTLENIHCSNVDGYLPKRAHFLHGQSQPVIKIEPHRGKLLQTDQELDIAIVGEGFLEIECPWNESVPTVYTRYGRLSLNDDGELVWRDKNGPRLTDQITVSPDAVAIQIGPDGTVLETDKDGSQAAVGQITLHRFEGQCGIRLIRNSYVHSDPEAKHISARPGEASLGVIRQGRLEKFVSDIDRDLHEMQMLGKWKNELVENLGLSAGQRYQLQHLPGDQDFFDQLAANARQHSN